MAIDRPETIGDAFGTDRSAAEDAVRRTFLYREECALAQGKKVRRRRCGSGDRGEAGFRTDQAERGREGSARERADVTETFGQRRLQNSAGTLRAEERVNFAGLV